MEKKTMKKLILIPIFLIGLSAVGYAAWTIYVSSGYEATIESIPGSDGVFEVTVEFADIQMDLTNSSLSKNTSLTIFNNNGLLNTNVSIDEWKYGSNLVNCPDFENDCSMKIFRTEPNYQEITDGEQVLLQSHANVFYSQISCVRLACPQIIGVNMSFSGVE